MLSGEDGEVLSDIEFVLPNEIIEKCQQLRPNGLSYFMSVNEESQTTSHLSIHKLTDDSIRIRITVMVLGTGNTKDIENHKQLGEEASTDDLQLDVEPNSETNGRRGTHEPRNDKNLRKKLKPGFSKSVDTHRLNKRLTSIWGSKRKRVYKKLRLYGLKPSLSSLNADAVVNPSLDDGDQEMTKVSAENELQNYFGFSSEPGSSTVIILKTVVRPQSTEASMSKAPLLLSNAGVGTRSCSSSEAAKQSIGPATEESSPEKGRSPPPKATSRDIAERLKARARKGMQQQVSCELCGDVMEEGYGQLYTHVKTQHNDCTFVRNYLEEIEPLACTPCSVCKKLFTNETSLTAHFSSAHPEQHQKSMEQLSKLGTQRHHIAGLRAAEKLRELSPREASSNDEDDDHESGPFVCKVCGRRCDSIAKYKRHTMTHGALRFSCKHCDKRFRIKENLLKHIRRVHEKATPDQAEHAPHSKSSFHSKTSPTPKGSSFKCDNCSVTFNRMSLLVTHMRYCLKSSMAKK